MQKANLALGVALVAIVIAIGGYFFPQVADSVLGAAGTRFPNGVSANTTSPSIAGQLRGTTLKLDTTNAATSTAAVGCIQTTATSTASPIRIVIGNVANATTTFQGTNAHFTVLAQFGTCPA